MIDVAIVTMILQVLSSTQRDLVSDLIRHFFSVNAAAFGDALLILMASACSWIRFFPRLFTFRVLRLFVE